MFTIIGFDSRSTSWQFSRTGCRETQDFFTKKATAASVKKFL
ncbi:hypothetical protein CLOSTMETH_01584 [[Clostridium] methylpentosum DSM 5476]|uniref:Uncharacterized protein n=1 Tax=[Clostridium] methylpentosum DSM 5476 TaxID=537013 RepID=C0ECL3_9FIRM|nr:hypothetical protein CLOSTMETH_01584 [[Clostridium] methylpentosum DSM 5476]